MMRNLTWPVLRYDDWKDTCHTLHRWIQIVGKIRTTQAPWTNHAWHSTLYVTSRGLTTSLIPDMDQSYSVDFDFVAHELHISSSNGDERSFPLVSESVASFHQRFFHALSELGIATCVATQPNEVPDPIPFAKDVIHCTYDPEASHRFWLALVNVNRVFQEFRSKFVGKCSPVHLFWGSLDLAVTRFSGRRAPEHPGGIPGISDEVVREAYSHEECSAGFWPGNEMVPYPAFYSYIYPQPQGYDQAKVLPPEAFFDTKLREFILPYEAVQKSADPDVTLKSFLQSTYEVAAELAHWDRKLLEDSPYLKLLQERQRSQCRIPRAA